jgi:hypothetical protein
MYSSRKASISRDDRAPPVPGFLAAVPVTQPHIRGKRLRKSNGRFFGADYKNLELVFCEPDGNIISRTLCPR